MYIKKHTWLILTFVLSGSLISALLVVSIDPKLVAIIVSVYFLSLLTLLVKRWQSLSWHELGLSLYVVLFCFAFTEFARTKLEDIEFPIYFILLPFLTLLFFVRQGRSFNLRNYAAIFQVEVLLFTLLLTFVLISILRSSDTYLSLINVMKLSIFFFNYFLLSCLIDKYRIWQRIVWLYVAFIIVVLLNAVYYFHFEPVHWARLVLDEGRSPNMSGFVAEMAFLILVGLSLTSKYSVKWIVYLIGFIVISYALMLTLSRGTWIALGVALTIFLMLSISQIKWKRLLLLFGLIISTSLVFPLGLPTNVLFRIQSIWDGKVNPQSLLQSSNENRLIILNRYLDETNDQGWFGIGYGLDLDVGYRRIDAHNSYVAIWAWSGVFAFLILLLFLVVHGRGLWLIRERLNQHDLWGNILISSYAAMLVHSFLGPFMFSHAFWFLLAFQSAAINIYLVQVSQEGLELGLHRYRAQESLDSRLDRNITLNSGRSHG